MSARAFLKLWCEAVPAAGDEMRGNLAGMGYGRGRAVRRTAAALGEDAGRVAGLMVDRMIRDAQKGVA